MGRQIELTWRCPACAQRNLGRFTTCQQCGAPKPADVEYEMPADTASAESVADPALLRLATAGANWKCSFCGSDQRKLDGSCAQCGASAELSPEAAQPLLREPNAPDLLGGARWLMWPRIGFLAGGFFCLFAFVVGYVWWTGRAKDYDASVSAVKWTQSITVEKYKLWSREGWRSSLAEGAFDVVSAGQKIHHYDQVLDGYDTQTYTEQVGCGEDCTQSAPMCHEVCTNSRNGFASCQQQCSGGGRSCTPRWCTETRTRQVPRYHQEPRYAEAVTYKIWDWGDDRTVTATGSGTTELRWPEDEAHVGQGLAEREQERERREAHYEVTISYGKDDHVTFPCPRSELSRFAPGTHHDVEVQRDTVLVDHLRVDPMK